MRIHLSLNSLAPCMWFVRLQWQNIFITGLHCKYVCVRVCVIIQTCVKCAFIYVHK